MYLSILLTVILILILSQKYKELNYKQLILVGLIILILCSYVLNSYKQDEIKEQFQNQNEINIKSKKMNELDDDELDELREELNNLDNTMSRRNNKTNTEDNRNVAQEQEKENEKQYVANVFNELTNTNTSKLLNEKFSNNEPKPTPSNTKLNGDIYNNSLISNKDDSILSIKPNNRNNLINTNNLRERFDDATTTTQSANNVPENNNQEENNGVSNTDQNLGNGSTLIQQKDGTGVSSVFSPQIIIKSNDEGSTPGVYMKKDPKSKEVPIVKSNTLNVNNWQQPTHNLWASEHTYYDGYNSSSDPWNADSSNTHQSSGSYNYEGSNAYLNNPPNQNYQNSQKSFYPGYAYMPPSNWDVPQKRPPVCVNNDLDTTKLPIGIADHGTPVFALEVNPIGRILATEEKVKYTNVGSILPKFTYMEENDYGNSNNNNNNNNNNNSD